MATTGERPGPAKVGLAGINTIPLVAIAEAEVGSGGLTPPPHGAVGARGTGRPWRGVTARSPSPTTPIA